MHIEDRESRFRELGYFRLHIWKRPWVWGSGFGPSDRPTVRAMGSESTRPENSAAAFIKTGKEPFGHEAVAEYVR